MGIRWLIPFFMLALGGCATVQTRPVAGHVANAEGVTYYLPRKDVLLTATRTPLAQADVAKKIAATEAASKAATDEIAKQKAEVIDLTRRLGAAGLSAATQAELGEKKKIAEHLIAALTAENKVHESDLAGLRPTLNQLSDGTCLFSYDIKLELQPAVADTSQRFVANLTHSALRDDDQTFVVTPGGLLSSADVTAADRSGDILVEIAGAIGGFGGFAPPTVTLESLNPPGKAANCATLTRSFKYLFDPNDSYAVTRGNDALKAAQWPFAVEPATGAPASLPSGLAFFGEGDEPGGSGTRCLGDPVQNFKPYPRLCPPLDGLLYRTAMPVQINLWQCNDATDCHAVANDRTKLIAAASPVQSAMLLLPQAGPISYIPMQSSAFVKTTDNVVFSDGMLTSWTASRPSEVLEVVRLPVKLLKAVISVPAEIIKLRVDYSSQTESLASAYAKQVEAEQKLRDLQACLKAAEQVEGGSAAACLE